MILSRGRAAAPLVLVALGCVVTWDLLRNGSLIGMDSATAFYPWYAFLGESLRHGHIPTWNPYQFAGTPFAADPESGWGYLPAMLLFTLLPLTQAASAFLLVHVLLASLATYALARSLGIPPIGALLSGVAYAYSGFFLGHAVCCFAYSSVAAWLPVGLFGVERGLRATNWPQRARWWAVGGLAVSQILAAWLGQGAYYSLILLGAYVAYRTLATSCARLTERVKAMVLHGVMLLLVGFGLAAIDLLPRLEYNPLSNLPGGYGAAGLTSPTAALTDWGIIEDWQTRLLTPGFHYAGLVTLALALFAPLVVRWRHATPFFFSTSMGVLVLGRWQPTPLHVALSVLPGFGPMHVHAPERALLVWFIGPAILAGASVGRLLALGRLGVVAAVVLTLCVVVDLRVGWNIQFADALVASGAYELRRLDLAAYYAPSGAARFLQSATASGRSRAIGYAQHVFGGPIPYTLGWADPRTVALGVNNRAMLTGVGDIQGYNPIHLGRFDRFMRVLNGEDQNYHQNDVFEAGLGSPLFDLLGVRYVVVPAVRAADQAEPRLARPLPVVYADDDVLILENAQALPRAWIVHSAIQLNADDALMQLAGGAIDARRTAVLEHSPPPLADLATADHPPPPTANEQTIPPGSAADERALQLDLGSAGPTDAGSCGECARRGDDSASANDQATISDYAPDAVRVDVDTATAGLLVLSDAYYPAWQARVDGSPAEVYVVDGALRGVGVPAGRHVVDFQYASAALPLGATITGLTVLSLLLSQAACALRRPTRTRCV